MPVTYQLETLKDPSDKRKAKEHIALDEFCALSDKITYEVKEAKGQIPEVYHIHYNIRGIVGVDALQNPIFGEHHIAEIRLPRRYPIEAPECKMVTDIWHPNVKHDGPHKGHICTNSKDFGKTYDIYLLVNRIGEIIQYKNYHAENVYPFPDDEKVARWVREFAEPNAIVAKTKPTDPRSLVRGGPDMEVFEPEIKPIPEPKKIQLTPDATENTTPVLPPQEESSEEKNEEHDKDFGILEAVKQEDGRVKIKLGSFKQAATHTETEKNDQFGSGEKRKIVIKPK